MLRYCNAVDNQSDDLGDGLVDRLIMLMLTMLMLMLNMLIMMAILMMTYRLLLATAKCPVGDIRCRTGRKLTHQACCAHNHNITQRSSIVANVEHGISIALHVQAAPWQLVVNKTAEAARVHPRFHDPSSYVDATSARTVAVGIIRGT